ncbi:MAG: MmcQ/YjbR family DNA-binding protein [Candidatus Dormibacteraceae bacterium]
MNIEDAAEIALTFPGVTEGTRWGNRTWSVAGKGFAWERPLSKADLRRLGDRPPPEGPLLAVRVANLEEKDVLMMDPPEGFLDIEHFRGYPAVLIKLEVVTGNVLRAAIAEAWRVCAGT